MKALFGLVAISLQAASPASEVDRVIAPVLAKIDAEKSRQATLPATDGITERFKRIYDLDQVVRMDVMALDMRGLTHEGRAIARAKIWSAIEAVDAQNLEAVLEMVPPEGWFLRSKYGGVLPLLLSWSFSIQMQISGAGLCLYLSHWLPKVKCSVPTMA